MKVSPLVLHLRELCPMFGRRITGGIDWETIEQAGKMNLPAAYVVLTDESAEPSERATSICQEITEAFDVCVVLEQRPNDEKGLSVADQLDDVRLQLCRALVGYAPGKDYEPIQYAGRELLLLNRNRAAYQFRFFTSTQVGGRSDPTAPPETYEELEADGLPPLEGVDFGVDFIDPMVDPNLSPTGPDGRVEFNATENRGLSP